ncbi:hypothetical protein KAI58_02960 [Candidatus Gracilibacteria bacterium]|nr:hypothetical protein [Candidatus Gracilibacteria bacterium]
MIKDKFNSKFRTYVREKVSPTNCYDKKCGKCDKCFVTAIYDSFKTVLNQNCIQIGSYPRFTAIRPLHDLDILYILGDWEEQNHNPQMLLEELLKEIKSNYVNPTEYKTEISLQTHSVTVVFKDNNDEEIFSVDIVPAYIFSTNEFQQDTYKVPEVLRQKHGGKRQEFYKKLSEEHKEMNWIHTDPRGYIKVAKQVNQSNDDFRKTVKFIKAWKNSCKEKYDDFKLKSFHIEQVITKYFQNKNDLEIFDSIFKFFVDIPEIIQSPKIKDRANTEKYIDEYLNNLTEDQKNKIIQARDCFLRKLENFSKDDLVENLIEACFYKRVSSSEQFLFDFKIPVLIDVQYDFKIDGFIQKKEGFRDGWISKILWKIEFKRNIKFEIVSDKPKVDLFKWKVKNDNSSMSPRGEITDNQTKNNPESTEFKGNHYVECYAILNNVCVIKAKQNVKLN